MIRQLRQQTCRVWRLILVIGCGMLGGGLWLNYMLYVTDGVIPTVKLPSKDFIQLLTNATPSNYFTKDTFEGVESNSKSQENPMLQENDVKRISISNNSSDAKSQKSKTNESNATATLPALHDTKINQIETVEEFMHRMKIRMERRQNITKQACLKLGINKSQKAFHFWSTELPPGRPWVFVSKKYGLLYTEIPKTGCSNWKKVLAVLNGLANSTDKFNNGEVHTLNLGSVEYYPSDEQKEIYSHMTKLVVVRDPMERLVSAYRNKVEPNPITHSAMLRKFSSEIAKKYGNRWIVPIKHFPDGTKSLTTCEFRVASLRCGNSRDVIKVLNATFDRYDNKTCVFESRWNGQRCSSKRAYYVTSQLCDGKRKCEVVASQAQFGVVTDCPSISNYLTIAYKCVPLEEMNTVVVCHEDSYEVKCPRRMISIGSVFYGRSNRKICPEASMLSTECSSDAATAILMSECNGKSTCTINVTPDWLRATDLCPATTKYLQVWFTCVEKQLETTIFRLPQNVPRMYEYDLQATFDDFVSYLIDPANGNFTKDVIDHGSPAMQHSSVRHWQFFHTLSYPCHLQYDVIAHTETIEEDARYLLKLIKAPPDLHYPEGFGEAGRSSTASDDVRNLLRSLDANKVKKLLEKYKPDYEIFGYAMPEYDTTS